MFEFFDLSSAAWFGGLRGCRRGEDDGLRGVGFRRVWVFLLFVLVGSAAGFAGQVAVAPEAISLRAGEAIALALLPRQEQMVRVVVDPALYYEVRVSLPGEGKTGSYVKVLTGASGVGEPVISDSGEDFVRVPILPGTASPVVLRVVGLTNSKSDTAPLAARIALTGSEPSAAKMNEVKTLAAFNRGERLRRSHTGTDEALAAYKDALAGARAMRDSVLEQRVLLSAGRMMMLGGKRYAEAVELERQAVAIDNTVAAPSVEAMAWKTLGGALLNTGQYEESLKASRRALALYEQTGETFWQGIVLENEGNASLNLGDLENALRTDERALALSRALHDDFGVVEMLAETGSIHESRGEYQEALNDFSEAVEVALPSSYNPMQGEAWLAMGRLHQSLGEPENASGDFQRALTIAQHTVSGLDELDAMGSLARLQLARGQAAVAQAGFTQALARARELKVLRPQSGLMVGLAETELALGQELQAERLLGEAVALATSIHQAAETAEACTKLGEIAEGQLRWAEAGAEFTRAMELYQSIPNKAGLAQANVGLARVERAQGQAVKALERLLTAMDLIEGGRASLSPGGLRTRYFATQRATYGQAIDVLMELDKAQPKAGYAAQAWTVAERAQARSLLDEVTSSGAIKSTDVAGQAIARRLAALDVQIRALQVSLAQTGTTPSDLETAARIGGDLRQALVRAEELESRLGKAGAAGSMEAMRITPPAFAAKELTIGDALVEYWVGDKASYAWVIESGGACTAFRLPGGQEIGQELAAYRTALLARDDHPAGETAARRGARLAQADRTAEEISGQLGGLLLPKEMQARLGEVRRLMVVADGPLTQIPFASLRVNARGGAGKAYLVERFDLVHEPSAAFRAVADDSATAPVRPLRVAVFADPVYNRADGRFALNSHSSGAMVTKVAATVTRDGGSSDLTHLARLPGSRREALAIEEIVGRDRASLFLGFDATPAAVRELDWPRYDIAHFATHAIAQAGRRDLSGILLSMLDQDGQQQNGVLWLRDIYEPRVPRELVVLSGCGTALGEAIPGEGMNSLTRAFLFSGTRQVAATLWSADDASASMLMGDFYRGLITRGEGAPGALGAAQRAVLEKPRYAAPYFWAGFMVEGSWTTR